MNYYLSSYKIGNKESIQQFKSLIPTNKKTAYISNALDSLDDLNIRIKSEQADIAELKSIGLQPEYLDLKKYFNQPKKLQNTLIQYGTIYVRGGNVFVLRQAMKLSGFDKIIKQLDKKNNNILYSGYSAGICILGPSLKGFELVDNAMTYPYPQQQKTIWNGLNLIDYAIVPHYKSKHPESILINKVIEQYKKDGTKFKPLCDGKAITIIK